MNVDGIILLWHVRPVLLGSTPAIRRPHVSCLDPVPVGLYGFRPGVRGGCGAASPCPPARAWGETRIPPGARGARPGGTVSCESGGALLSHTLSGAVPSPCRALASGFGMGPGVSPWPWPPQILSTFPGRTPGGSDRDGPGTGQWTRKKSCDAFRTLPAVGNHPKDAIRATTRDPDDGV